MTVGARHYRTMPLCPGCGPSGNVIKDGMKGARQRFRCTRCGNQVHARDTQPKESSGNVAGPITIGRGSVWGAGRA